MYQLGPLSTRDIIIASVFFVVLILDGSTIKTILSMDFDANFIAIILSPLIAVIVGELLRKRTHNKQQRDDLVRRLLLFCYQISPTYHGGKEGILGALNEIKYWYFSNSHIKDLTHKVMDKMGIGQDAQAIFIELIQIIARKEGHYLSSKDIERVFSIP